MARHRPLPGQSCFLPVEDPVSEILRAKTTLPTEGLVQVVREYSYEILRRGRAVPIVAPIAEAMAGYPCAEAGL